MLLCRQVPTQQHSSEGQGGVGPHPPSPSSSSPTHPSSLLHLNSVVQAVEAPGAHTGCLEEAEDNKRELGQGMELLGLWQVLQPARLREIQGNGQEQACSRCSVQLQSTPSPEPVGDAEARAGSLFRASVMAPCQQCKSQRTQRLV